MQVRAIIPAYLANGYLKRVMGLELLPSLEVRASVGSFLCLCYR
jgi:hypothetical protein